MHFLHTLKRATVSKSESVEGIQRVPVGLDVDGEIDLSTKNSNTRAFICNKLTLAVSLTVMLINMLVCVPQGKV